MYWSSSIFFYYTSNLAIITNRLNCCLKVAAVNVHLSVYWLQNNFEVLKSHNCQFPFLVFLGIELYSSVSKLASELEEQEKGLSYTVMFLKLLSSELENQEKPDCHYLDSQSDSSICICRHLVPSSLFFHWLNIACTFPQKGKFFLHSDCSTKTVRQLINKWIYSLNLFWQRKTSMLTFYRLKLNLISSFGWLCVSGKVTGA